MSKMFETLQGGVHSLPRLILKVFGVYIALTLASIVLAAPLIDYACSWQDLIGFNLPIFLISLVGCAAIVFSYSFIRDALTQRKKTNSPKFFHVVSLGLALLLFVLQLYIQKSAGFICGWDVSDITQVGDRAPADISTLAHYLSIYPNQQFLYGLFHKLATLATLFGFPTYKALVGCGCFCVTVAIVLSANVCRRLFGGVRALIFQVFASVFIGLNGWILVPYSDTYAMLFTSMALWFYVISTKHSLRLMGLTASSLLGYMVKPTAVFFLFAVICLNWLPSVVRAFRECIKASLVLARTVIASHICNSFLSIAVPVVLGAVLAIGAGVYIRGNYISTENGSSRGITHYLSMGINPSSKGIYSAEENELSDSFSNPTDRRAALIDLWKKHLRDLGPTGVVKLWFEKNLTNYADGSFSWKREVVGGSTNWAGWHIPWNTKTLSIYGDSLTVKNWYGLVDDDQRDGAGIAYGWYCQTLWFVVLIGCSASALRRARVIRYTTTEHDSERRANHICSVIALSLIFLSGFLLIFECRARYLFLFSPYYVLFAIDGLVGNGSAGELIADRLSKLRKNLKARER